MDNIDRWRPMTRQIAFQPEDFEILDLAVSLSPELRIAALTTKWLREAAVNYPIRDYSELERVVPAGSFSAAGHIINGQTIRRYLPLEFLPIHHEGELISRVYIALMRCRHEMAVAAQAKPDALEALRGER